MRTNVSKLYYRMRPSWGLYQSLLKTQFLPYQELQLLQLQKFIKLFEYSKINVPYWRNIFKKNNISIGDFRKIEDIQRLPILEKNDLPKILKGYTTSHEKFIEKRTGGTTGEPVSILVSPNHINWGQAAMLRFYSWMNFNIGERRGKLFAAPTKLGVPEYNIKSRIRNQLSNTIFWDALDLSPLKIQQVIKEIKKFKPKLLFGYTSCLLLVAQSLIENHETLDIPGLRIVNSAEPLEFEKRQIIEKGFGAKIYDHYGTREIGYIADESTPDAGLNVHMEYLIVEIVDDDGRWVEDGEIGDVLITQLENFGQPVFRYRVGDRAIRSEKDEKSEFGLEIISSIIGRSTDFVLLKNGKKITGLAFPHLLKDFPISEYQVVQKSIDEVVLKIVYASNVTKAQSNALIGSISRLLPGVNISLHIVDKIPRSKSGKLRSVISELEIP